jgi:hypothetical protein
LPPLSYPFEEAPGVPQALQENPPSEPATPEEALPGFAQFVLTRASDTGSNDADICKTFAASIAVYTLGTFFLFK